MTTEMEFVPKLKTKFVADDGREFTELGFMFAEWMKMTRSLKARTKIYTRNSSSLNARECKEFWAWIGRTDPVPKRLRIYVWRDDVERIWPNTT